MCTGKHIHSLSLYPLIPPYNYRKVYLMSCMKKYVKLRSFLHLVMPTIFRETSGISAYIFTLSVHMTILGCLYKLIYSLIIVDTRTPIYSQIGIHTPISAMLDNSYQLEINCKYDYYFPRFNIMNIGNPIWLPSHDHWCNSGATGAY